ncbi:hypothetical protein ACRE_084400 [Hapsidospora chrysogenum ATCC 11550]|uniref:Uncharacterized protein n=1 Tax=Hapsidospora chrysogenum (strain ATCC 11550 / CBS 779.69 / DSM 880 / IAM 14645 / JCM 23072 / IMI 49137) TaxID=857340 RepID=A0A086SUT8_HAPC1|nr:hypothetical protein ACRE_084400 [Hapsidospora chrysogenum ATCC 11550]
MWPDFAGVKTRKLAGLRRVGDVSTLIIPLDTDFVLVPSTPDFVIEYAQFEVVDKFSKNVNSQDLDYGAGTSRLEQASLPLFLQSQPTPFQAPVGNPPHSCPFLEIRARELASPAVRHVYTTASTEWHGYAEKRLQRWAWVELYKLEPAKRPSQSPNGIPLVPGISIPQAFEVSWDYADDQIPEWYREWEQTRVG